MNKMVLLFFAIFGELQVQKVTASTAIKEKAQKLLLSAAAKKIKKTVEDVDQLTTYVNIGFPEEFTNALFQIKNMKASPKQKNDLLAKHKDILDRRFNEFADNLANYKQILAIAEDENKSNAKLINDLRVAIYWLEVGLLSGKQILLEIVDGLMQFNTQMMNRMNM